MSDEKSNKTLSSGIMINDTSIALSKKDDTINEKCTSKDKLSEMIGSSSQVIVVMPVWIRRYAIFL